MSDSIFFRKGSILYRVKSSDIDYFQANGDYTIGISNGAKYLSSMGITELANLEINDALVQVHRSYLVNVNKIDSIDLITLKIHIGKHEIPLSKSRKNILIEKLRIIK